MPRYHPAHQQKAEPEPQSQTVLPWRGPPVFPSPALAPTSAEQDLGADSALCTTVDSVAVEEQERERRRQVVEKFQKAPFEEIAAHCGARVSEAQQG